MGRGPTKRERQKVDTQWFFDRLEAKRYSLRGFAKLIDMIPGALSRRFNGITPISADDVVLFARFLDAPYEEIARRAGLKVPKDPTKAVKIVGVVDAHGQVKNGKSLGTIERPASLPGDTVAVRDSKRGWTYFFAPAAGRVSPDAVGRMAIVESRWVGILERGHDRGTWNVVGLCGEMVAEGVKVGVAAPVLVIVP